MTEVTIIASPTSQHQSGHAVALAEGLKRHGIQSRTQRSRERVHTRIVACWGWRVGRTFRAAGHEVLVMERGYLGDRFAWTSLGWNGLNGRATFAPAPEDCGARFHAHFRLAPWRTGGDHVLLCGQVRGDMSLQGRDLGDWYTRAARDAARAYGLPVRFRPHPVALARGHVDRVPGTISALSRRSLEDDLARAAAVITWNSNAGVDAVVAGVPAVVMDGGSMAWPIAAHAVTGSLVRPDRAAWAARLAWCQFTLDELRDGSAWELVGQGVSDRVAMREAA